jgi:hypothetical protein
LPDTLAFVAPWYGQDIAGGAEAECRATARALRRRGVSAEILTTCARDHACPWLDHHPEGVTEGDGFVVHAASKSGRATPSGMGGSSDVSPPAGSSRPSRKRTSSGSRSIPTISMRTSVPSATAYAFIPYCVGTRWEGALVALERLGLSLSLRA